MSNHRVAADALARVPEPGCWLLGERWEEAPVLILRYGSPKAVLIGTRAFGELLDRVALRTDLRCREQESAGEL